MMKTYVNCSYSLYEYGETGNLPHPRDIEEPKNSVLAKWIPQTMADSIWCVYEFSSSKQAEEFVGITDGVYGKATKRIVDNDFLNKWKVLG